MDVANIRFVFAVWQTNYLHLAASELKPNTSSWVNFQLQNSSYYILFNTVTDNPVTSNK